MEANYIKERMTELNDQASKFNFHSSISITRYLTSLQSILNMAKNSVSNQHYKEAYIFYLRLSILVIEKLKKHPQYSHVREEEILKWKRECLQALDQIEQLKSVLRTEFSDQYKHLEAEKADKAHHSRITSETTSSNYSVEKNINPPNSNNVPDYPSIVNVEIPYVDRSTKPKYGSFDKNSNGNIWRTVRVSPKLARIFENVARTNSENNKETCGTLCGKMIDNEYHITDVILPKQTGTSDSCSTLDEWDILSYIEQTGTIVLGWIHTHPSQTAFLSSVDQHCQLSYQLLIPEAIAIVVSPKHQETCYFSLTPDYGIEFLKNCTKTSFHPHEGIRSIYEKSCHVITDESINCDLKDFR